MCLAVPGKLISIDTTELGVQGRIDFSGVIKEIDLSFTREAEVGSYLLVHAGLAISVL